MNNEPDSDSFSNSSQHSFEQLLKASDSQLPPPGPAYYLARRALWLKSPDNFVPHDDSVPRQLSTSRQKLENLLHTSDAVYNKEAWEGGIEKVFKGLSGGATLKRRLPLNLVVSRMLKVCSVLIPFRSRLFTVHGSRTELGQRVQ